MAGYLLHEPKSLDQTRTHMQKNCSPILPRTSDSFLCYHTGQEPFLFDDFGLAEAVSPDVSNALVSSNYYEGFELPDTRDYRRVRAWEGRLFGRTLAARRLARKET